MRKRSRTNGFCQQNRAIGVWRPKEFIEQALQVIRWCCWRWRIEQLFATLKRAGLNLEATQLESVGAIQRLTVLALSISLRTLQLLKGRDNSELSAPIALTDEQLQFLTHLAPSLQGRTSKQQGKIELLESIELPERVQALVTILLEEETELWLKASQSGSPGISQKIVFCYTVLVQGTSEKTLCSGGSGYFTSLILA